MVGNIAIHSYDNLRPSVIVGFMKPAICRLRSFTCQPNQTAFYHRIVFPKTRPLSQRMRVQCVRRWDKHCPLPFRYDWCLTNTTHTLEIGGAAMTSLLLVLLVSLSWCPYMFSTSVYSYLILMVCQMRVFETTPNPNPLPAGCPPLNYMTSYLCGSLATGDPHGSYAGAECSDPPDMATYLRARHNMLTQYAMVHQLKTTMCQAREINAKQRLLTGYSYTGT